MCAAAAPPPSCFLRASTKENCAQRFCAAAAADASPTPLSLFSPLRAVGCAAFNSLRQRLLCLTRHPNASLYSLSLSLSRSSLDKKTKPPCHTNAPWRGTAAFAFKVAKEMPNGGGVLCAARCHHCSPAAERSSSLAIPGPLCRRLAAAAAVAALLYWPAQHTQRGVRWGESV